MKDARSRQETVLVTVFPGAELDTAFLPSGPEDNPGVELRSPRQEEHPRERAARAAGSAVVGTEGGLTGGHQAFGDVEGINGVARAAKRDRKKYVPLEPDEEVTLAQHIKEGWAARKSLQGAEAEVVLPENRLTGLQSAVRQGEEAADSLVRAYSKLIQSIARQHLRTGMEFQDFVQEGASGLMRAVRNFDPAKGDFEPYAIRWIHQFMSRASANQARVIRLPVEVVEELKRLRREGDELLLRNGVEPTIQQLADGLGAAPERVVELMHWEKSTLSFEQPVGQDYERTRLGDFIKDKAAPAPDMSLDTGLREALKPALALLNERERVAVCLYFGLNGGRPMTFAEIGKELGLNRETIRLSVVGALEKIRSSAYADSLKDYYES